MKYLMTGSEMKNWEKQAMERYRVPSLLLMERAAQAVVEKMLTGGYDLHKVLIACGTGNNGGDGLATARLLQARGIHAEVCLTGALDRLSDEAKQQMEMYRALSGKFVTAPAYDEYTVIVDAIFGIGCNREITGIAAEVIEGINHSDVPVISIDVPSGVSADTGEICGYAVKADATVTFFTWKLGMMFYPGREYCGRIFLADMGIPFEKPEQCQAVTYCGEDIKKLPERKADSHKGTYGKVLVMAGSPKISGAAYLAAAGAYRIGAGLVKLYTPKENLFAVQTLLPEAIMEIYNRERPTVKQLKQCMEWADAIVIGPGFGTDRMAEKILKYTISKSKVPIVIDADGINILAKSKTCLLDKNAPLVLTPHIQEMSRLTGTAREEILKDRMGAAKRFTDTYPVTLVLKDACTVVKKENERFYINASGNSGMATGGSGDVLAGMIGGLIAQGMNDLEAARLGVYVHGRAGDAAAQKKGAYSMIATDILDGIAEVTVE